VMELGELDEPDLTLTTDYGTAVKLFVDQDQAAGMQAFMSGKIKVQGDMMKMMAMQTSMPQDEAAKEIAREIKEITAPAPEITAPAPEITAPAPEITAPAPASPPDDPGTA
jgi:SCP-2 sterol transfer family